VFGVQLAEALKVAEKIDATVVDMRFVKPLDEALREIAASHELLVTIEENAIMGGAGARSASSWRGKTSSSRCCTWACRMYVEHAKPAQMLAECGLDEAGIEASVRERMTLLGL
jgi:1-deoxy-D-xylulose-5-phosphate synthase